MADHVSDPVYKSKFGRTICEVHREIYDMLYEEKDNIKAYNDIVDKLQESYTYAKKMDAKLRQYKNNYDDNWWEKEKQSVILQKLSQRKNK